MQLVSISGGIIVSALPLSHPHAEGGTSSQEAVCVCVCVCVDSLCVPATQLLRAYAASRGLTAQMGRPDEHRSGREMLKDYRDGKMLGCRMPPPLDAGGRDEATAPVSYWVPTLRARTRNLGNRAQVCHPVQAQK